MKQIILQKQHLSFSNSLTVPTQPAALGLTVKGLKFVYQKCL
jgi:hypothetical protein